jgi:hypothetical protein
MTELTKEQHGQIEVLRKLAFDMPPAFQYRLACFVAENVGYVLGPDPLRGGPDEARDHAPTSLALPEIPYDDADFTPDIARKIIVKYQQLLRAAPPARSTATSDEAAASVAKLECLDWIETEVMAIDHAYRGQPRRIAVMNTEQDIVERLRNHVNHRNGPSLLNGARQMMLDAADEITNLRAERDAAWEKICAVVNKGGFQ